MNPTQKKPASGLLAILHSARLAERKGGKNLGGNVHMARRKLKVGNKVRAIGYRPGFYSPGVEDEMGTEALFRSVVGRCYTIRGFDEYGHVDLQPTRDDSIWIEPDLVELLGKPC